VKSNNEGWNCQKKKQSRRELKNKRKFNNKNVDEIQKNIFKIKWLGMKSKNKIQLEKKIKAK
jgi:hypothetical protein